MDIFDKLARPPKTALKTIGAGRLKGKSDINPQWRYRAMTEIFGLCGIGWKYTVDRIWTEPGHHNEVFAFAQVSIFFKSGDIWSEPIQGLGGHKLVVAENAGMHNNDEAYKMAITDAIGTALKMIGVASEIYEGNFDGTKYNDEKIDTTKQIEAITQKQQFILKPFDYKKEVPKESGFLVDAQAQSDKFQKEVKEEGEKKCSLEKSNGINPMFDFNK